MKIKLLLILALLPQIVFSQYHSGGKLIISGGTLSNVDLVLKPGATLQITNGGILETRNGFEAPVGAIVNIQYGQIL